MPSKFHQIRKYCTRIDWPIQKRIWRDPHAHE